MKILLVEDDALLGGTLHTVLKEQHHVADWVGSCASARAALLTGAYQLVILDLGLPDGDGRDVIRWLRIKNLTVPVLVLSARGEIRDRVAALDLGADDYMTKPYDLDELLARVRATARRPHGLVSASVTLGDLKIDLAGCQVWWTNELVGLRPREYQVLAVLVERRNRVVSRREIEELLSTWDESIESNVVEVIIHRLRKKTSSTLIDTVKGIGYVVREP